MRNLNERFEFSCRKGRKIKPILRVALRCITLCLISWSLVTQSFGADIEWRLLKDISLNDRPIDVVTSLDGSYIFILTSDAVLVYASSADRIVNRIPIDKAFDKLSYSGAKSELILTSTTSKALRIIKIYPIYQINTDGLPFLGPPKAPVTIVVFDDYQCSACAVLEQILKDVLQIYPEEVKLVVKHFPNANHSISTEAAIAARAAHAQGKFWEFHRALFENQSLLDKATIEAIARQLDLDMNKFNQDLRSQDIKAMVDRDLGEGRQLGINVTPTVFINGKYLERISLGDINEMIEAELPQNK